MTRVTPTVKPGYSLAVSPCWRPSGVFTRNLSSFTGTKRDAAHDAGFRAVAVQLDNTTPVQALANRAELDDLYPLFGARGWVVAGWGTAGQDTNAFEDGTRQRWIADSLNLPWIVNIELWGEWPYRSVTADWMRGWLALGPTTRPVMLSCLSSVTPHYARDMDYRPFVDYPGCSISPQVYCASDPNYTLPAMWGSFQKSIVPANRIMPTCNVEAGKPVPPRYKNWRGPRYLWTGEDCQPEDFRKVLVAG